MEERLEHIKQIPDHSLVVEGHNENPLRRSAEEHQHIGGSTFMDFDRR